MLPFTFQTSLPQIDPNLGIGQAIKNWQAVRANSLANQLAQEKVKNPMFGQGLTGPAGQIMGLESIRHQFGENSPQYQEAQKLFNSQMNLANQRANYFGANVEYKNLPQISKLQLAQQQANQAGNTQNASEIQGSKQKAITTSQNINRATYGDVVKKTINQIPLSTLQNFSGVSGDANLAWNKIMNIVGHPSDDYNTYKTFQNTTLPLLREQLTKFYGGSVQPDAQKELDTLANPTSWSDNPTIVKQSLSNLQNLINKESGVYDQSVNQSVPQGNKANIPGINPSSSSLGGPTPEVSLTAPSVQAASSAGTVQMKAPNGRIYEVPQSDVSSMSAQGGVIVG